MTLCPVPVLANAEHQKTTVLPSIRSNVQSESAPHSIYLGEAQPSTNVRALEPETVAAGQFDL